MTVLAACQEAISRLIAQRPTAVFSSDVEICVEIASLSNEAAEDIAASRDWQALTRLAKISGDGKAMDWPLPPDYGRMVNGTAIHSKAWVWNWYSASGLDGWLELMAFAPVASPGFWVILEDRLSFLPAIPSGDEARFYYVTRDLAVASDGKRKRAFDNDGDSFLLSERLLTLALIWRWKAMKGMNYAEDLNNYNLALSQDGAADKGSMVIRKGDRLFRGAGIGTAWPWLLG